MSGNHTISICIPHWQVKSLIALCLRSLRKYSGKYDIEVIVVDNGSRDESLDYLRTLGWIRLIERPDESPANWPRNVYTAWDLGVQKARGEFFVTMHSDVFVKHDAWLDAFLREMAADSTVAGVGAWKLDAPHPLYEWTTKVGGACINVVRNLFGAGKTIDWRIGHYPRDYCVMYRSETILKHRLVFCHPMNRGGGYAIAKQLWDAGYHTRVLGQSEMAANIVHVAHGTAAMVGRNVFRHQRTQAKAERRLRDLLAEPWIKDLSIDDSLDR